MAMVIVLRGEQYVIVYMDILGMDVKLHQLQQRKNQTMIPTQIKLIVLMYQLTPTQSG